MSKIKYLLDENVDPRLRTALEAKQQDVVVWLVGEPGAPARGTLDPEILEWCQRNAFILVTNNRRSMPIHLMAHLEQGQQVPGIFILDPTMTLGETAEELVLIYAASNVDEYADVIHYLPLSY